MSLMIDQKIICIEFNYMIYYPTNSQHLCRYGHLNTFYFHWKSLVAVAQDSKGITVSYTY